MPLDVLEACLCRRGDGSICGRESISVSVRVVLERQRGHGGAATLGRTFCSRRGPPPRSGLLDAIDAYGRHGT